MKRILLLLVLLLSLPVLEAATLHGTVYNSNLEPETKVLLEINTVPVQKFLSADGSYSFDLNPGTYQITATKSFLSTSEKITIVQEGEFRYDIFLLPDTLEEEQLWTESEEELVAGETIAPRYWAYAVLIVILAFLFWRFWKLRRKYGSLRHFRKTVQQEQQRSPEQFQADLEKEPDYLEKTLLMLRQNNGRMYQKELRKEFLQLSEAKVSLILTELEHRGKIEKIKKGRGNVILLKEEAKL